MTATATTTTCIELALLRIASTSQRHESVTGPIGGVGGQRERELCSTGCLPVFLHNTKEAGRLCSSSSSSRRTKQWVYREWERLCVLVVVVVCVCGGGKAADLYSPHLLSFSLSFCCSSTCKSAPERTGTHRERVSSRERDWGPHICFVAQFEFFFFCFIFHIKRLLKNNNYKQVFGGNSSSSSNRHKCTKNAKRASSRAKPAQRRCAPSKCGYVFVSLNV